MLVSLRIKEKQITWLGPLCVCVCAHVHYIHELCLFASNSEMSLGGTRQRKQQQQQRQQQAEKTKSSIRTKKIGKETEISAS